LFDRHGEANASGEEPVLAGEGGHSDLYKLRPRASMSKWRKQKAPAALNATGVLCCTQYTAFASLDTLRTSSLL
jgi:hypothetical protein